jgi:hypothetical protein
MNLYNTERGSDEPNIVFTRNSLRTTQPEQKRETI